MSENGATNRGQLDPSDQKYADRRCIVCNRFLAETDLKSCPTCKTDNTGWITPESPERFDLFPVAAWCAVFVTVVLHQWGYLLLRAGWLPTLAWGSAFLESARIGVASVMIAAIIYALRDPLRHYELKRALKIGGWRPGLILLAVFAIVIAIADGMAVVLLAAAASMFSGAVESADRAGSVALLTPLISLPFLTVAIMLIGVNTYVRRLQSRFPPPIYCDTNKMSEVILKMLGDSYLALSPVRGLSTHAESNRADGKQAEAKAVQDKEAGATVNDGDPTTENTDADDPPILRAPTCLEIVSLRRNRMAGLDLTIREHITRWERQGPTAEYMAKEEEPEYDVSTDQWAQITRFEPRKRKIRLAIYEPDVQTGR